MKREYKNNLIGLIALHLLLLAYPLISKTFHVHHDAHHHHWFSGTEQFDCSENSCPVCDFEFYNFVSTTPEQCFKAQPVVKIDINPIPEIIFTPFIRYFSLRAPPTA